MDMSAVIHESMVMDEGKMICPFRSFVGSQCVKEKCAMWIKDYERWNDGEIMNDNSGCAFVKIAERVGRHDDGHQ